jgi:hypothetical protein
LEYGVLTVTLLIIIVLGALIGINPPPSPTVYSYSDDYQTNLKLSQVNQDAIKLKKELLEYNKLSYEVYGLHIAEDHTLCQPHCVDLTYNVTLLTSHGTLSVNANDGV